MKKLMSFLLCLLVLFLLATNPSTGDFTSWYVEQCVSDSILPLPDQVCDAFAQYLESDVKCSNYGLCSVYTYRGSMTLGIGQNFFPMDELATQFETLRSSYDNWSAQFDD